MFFTYLNVANWQIHSIQNLAGFISEWMASLIEIPNAGGWCFKSVLKHSRSGEYRGCKISRIYFTIFFKRYNISKAWRGLRLSGLTSSSKTTAGWHSRLVNRSN
jgi:hypothetical protein